MAHKIPIRVYYEDTDFGGVVYYANYLKFIERGRSEWVRSHGIDQRALKDEAGIVFAVRRLVADYLRPALFDDALEVVTEVKRLSGVRLDLHQEVRRGDEVLFTAEVTLVCMHLDGKPARLPDDLRAALS
jgi:acyl-CoA thioester hydrolase